MAEIKNLADIAFCAGRGCRKKVKVPPDSKGKRTLCRDCWHRQAEEAARHRYHWTHVAHRNKRHEMFMADDLALFIQEYEIEHMD